MVGAERSDNSAKHHVYRSSEKGWSEENHQTLDYERHLGPVGSLAGVDGPAKIANCFNCVEEVRLDTAYRVDRQIPPGTHTQSANEKWDEIPCSLLQQLKEMDHAR